jgi:hypothetical protein
LVRADGDGVLVIGQLSHSWLAGQIARAWGNERFGGFAPREEIVLGAALHDIGWAERDRVPELNRQTGRPRGFLESTVAEHLAVWRAAPDALMSLSAWAALVASLHGAALSRLRARANPEDAEALRPFIEQERARQDRLARALGATPGQVQHIQRLVWAWDSLSLALCLGWRPHEVSEVPTADGLASLTLCADDTVDPWPFAAPRVELRCEGRRLAARYEDAEALCDEYERAVPEPVTFVLAGPG